MNMKRCSSSRTLATGTGLPGHALCFIRLQRPVEAEGSQGETLSPTLSSRNKRAGDSGKSLRVGKRRPGVGSNGLQAAGSAAGKSPAWK